MPSYRGVSQSDLVTSITDAFELLEAHSTGPECQKLIDAMREVDPATGVSKLGAIQNAKDDKELAAALGASGANWLFICTNEVMQYHALNNTDGKGYDVAERLSKWGAGSGARVMAYYPIDAECDSWLAVQYARRVEPTEENIEKIAGLAGALTQNATSLGIAFDAMVQMIQLNAKGASDDDMRQIFLGLDLHERHITRGALSALSMDGAEADLDFEQPMGMFGVVIDDLTTGKANWGDPSMKAVRDRVEQALGPFYETDEVNMTGVGIIVRAENFVKGVTPQGIVFGASKRAAQAVADAMPDMKVLDGEGHAIAPNTLKPLPPKPGFNL